MAAVLANLFFALMHLHLSWRMTASSFVAGLGGSALYARHRTLAGVALSQAAVGLFAFFVIGLG